MKKRIYVGFGLTLVLVVAISLFAAEANRSENQSQPRITNMANQRMLVLTMTGDPAKVSKTAFQELYRAFYNHAGSKDKQTVKIVRARWPLSLPETDKRAWVGKYALPISDNFPSIKEPNIAMEVWEYGIVVEIVHIGPYADASSEDSVLKSFISRNGYAISGDHEEEYLGAPGKIFKGDPDKYQTIIRYRVERMGEAPAPIVKNVP